MAEFFKNFWPNFFNPVALRDFWGDEDKKTYELMDMPIDVMENIVEYLDIFDRIKLARTSRSLQTFVKDQKLVHHTLKLTALNGMTSVSFGESVIIWYVGSDAGCYKIFKNNLPNVRTRVTNVQDVSYWQQAFLDTKSFLKNPKLHLDTLHIESEDYDEHVSNVLEDSFKFTHYLNVKKLILEEYSLDKLPKIIPSLKPGYLLTINISSHTPEVDSMNTLFEMEQWKQAKCFTMTVPCFIWPVRHLFHFKEFTVALKQFSEEDVRQMKEVLFKSPHFKKCSLTLCGVSDMFIFDQEFGNALRENPYIYHYSVPNSADYFELKVDRYFFGHIFEVTRKKI